MTLPPIRHIRGMADILPSESWKWQYIEQQLRELSSAFGYQRIQTPIVEQAELFIRGVGENTDIVGKEMYLFEDRGGDLLALRPEMTASIVRAAIEHHFLQQQPIWRLWYYGPMFRRERPQKGRYRQFHQYGVEILGSPHPESDVEVIHLAWQLLQRLGLDQLELRINTLGTSEVQQRYRTALVEYLTPHADQLSPESQQRLHTNPLRILDSKAEQDQHLLQNAPSILDFLDSESAQFFQTVQQLLTHLQIPFVIDPRLVRGLDYYCHTAFEIRSPSLGAQNAICGGGRYDGLAELLGGKAFAAVGFAIGIERLLLLLEAENKLPTPPPAATVYIVAAGNQDTRQHAMRIASQLRQQGIATVTDLLRRSVKAQLREANRLRIPLAVIAGEKELAHNEVLVKHMQTGEQITVPLETLTDTLHRLLS